MKKHNLVLSIGLVSMLTLLGCGNNNEPHKPAVPPVNPVEPPFVSEVVQFQGSEYKTVQSSVTKKVWLDRNIGAVQVCQSATDTACYGDYFQWGRYMDGHQNSNSSTSTQRIANINNKTNKEFIIENSDWTTSDIDGVQRTANWSKLDGTFVCPINFRVPTISEIKAETSLKFLELPFAGMRSNQNGELVTQDKMGFLWTSSSSTLANKMSNYLLYTQQDAQGAGESGTSRGAGMPIRCIKDQ